MKYKLIVVDMDGTLLNSNREVSLENQMALKKAQDMGIQVAIATGRIFTSARFYARFIGVKGPIIACNGGVIKDIENDNILHSSPISKTDSIRVLEILKKHNVYFHTYDENKMYTEKLAFSAAIYNDWNEDQSEENRIHIEKLDNIISYLEKKNIELLKIMAVDDDTTKMEIIRKELEQIDNITIDKSWHNNLEVMSKGVSKGKGIEILSKTYKIKPEEIIAFGDNFNDLSMKSYVGTFVAMENGEDYVKSKATYITASNDESGVAKGLEHLLFKSR